MYFSLITPAEGQQREAAHEWAGANHLGGTYVDHQWLWRLFPAPAGTPRDFLFRRGEVSGLPRFHVVSHRPPQYDGNAWRIQTTSYAPRLAKGDRLRFQLRANPSVRHNREGGKSKRHDVVMEAKKRLLAERGVTRWADWPQRERPALYALVQQSCAKWLADRAARLGFAVDPHEVLVDAYQQHGLHQERGLRLSTVDFSGTLMVACPDRFVATLFSGVGHGKAFGCGLLLVRPLK